MKPVVFKLFCVGILFFLVMGCSSDLFDPPKEPVIKELTLSAYEVNPGDTIYVAVDVEDEDDAVLAYQWEVSDGLLIPPVDGPTVSWIMPISGGNYTIKVKITNQDDKSSSKRVAATVRSFQNPVVQITSPQDNAFFVQNQNIKIQANASHENGISVVNLYIDEVLQRTLSQGSNELYSADLALHHWVGSTEVKVEAIARTTQTVACDSIMVNIEGIVLGK